MLAVSLQLAFFSGVRFDLTEKIFENNCGGWGFTAKQFSCILRSPDSLFCYATKVKSPNNVSKGRLHQPPGGPEIT